MLEITSGTLAQGADLIAELNAELVARSPVDGLNFFSLAPEELEPARGTFLIATLDGAAAGCGAVRLIEPEVAEIKRMYTRPTARGQGVGRALLEALEAEAWGLGARRLVLETGPLLHEALGLYAAAGFTRCACWGEYVASLHSVCLAKDL